MPNYTTLPLEAHKNRSLFFKHARNIGGAYRNQAFELISICRYISRIATPKFAHEDAELRRVLRVCDLALRSAADSGTKVTDEANARFEEATQVLTSHSARVHRLDLPLSGSVYSRMEMAKRNDSAEGMWSHTVKRATLLLQGSKDKWGPMTTINFVLLRSPLLSSRDPDTVVVSQEFSTRPSLPEILWNFSRYKDRARVTLEQNPHFYLRFPADESGYMFQCHPLYDLGTLRHNYTVYVLFDGPGRVFLDIEHKLRIFANVWLLNGSLVFRDRSGVLEGEQLVRGFSIRSNLRYCEQQVVFYNSAARSRLEHRYLRPIVITSSADPSRSAGIFEDWTTLDRLASHSINIHIYDSRGSSGSINSLDLPPPPPTSERPGYPVLYTTINTLDDDILLGIFSYYRLDEKNAWNVRLGWCKLSHVCRRWYHLVHSSAFHLGMHILCTNGTRTVDTLDHLPTLPLFVVYLDTTVTISGKDELGMYCALRLRDRVHHIVLHLPSSILHKSLALMEEPFSMLEHLSLWSATKEDTNLVLPKTFLAPNLRHLTLFGINLPKRLRLLTSTVSLVTLVFTNIRASGYFLPRLLAARLQSLPQLEELSIGFSIPIPRPSAERDLLSKWGALVVLPNLKHLTFQGIGAYMECLVAQIRAPLLERLDITLFNQIAFALPHLSHFTNITEGLKLPIAEISFGRDAVSVVMDHHNTRQHNLNGHFALRVTCTQLDWQIDCAAQICSALMPALFDVEELKLKFYEQMMPTEWQDGDVDHTTWHELFRTFTRLKELHLCAALSQELSRVFQAEGVGSDPGLLPGLQEIVCEVKKSDVHDLFSSFIRARRIAGRPVSLVSAYSIKAKALSTYTATPDVPIGISFAKDEVLDIIDMRGNWWQAQKEDNTRGVAPPSYLQIIQRSAGSSKGSGPHQAKALYAYTGSLDDPNVISFSEGEILNVIDTSGWWWQARKEGGTLGIAPSSYLQIIGQQPARCRAKALYPYTASPDYSDEISFSEGEILDIIEMDDDWWQVRKEDSTLGTAPSNFLRITEQQLAGYKATALYAYTASPDSPSDISFSKDEILDIIEMDGDWWQVRKEDGTLGTAPSNFLRIIEREQTVGFKAKGPYIQHSEILDVIK